MAELNYFDPPDPTPNEPHYPDIEDRRRRDFADWQNGRWLDPTPFTHVKDQAWRLPPGTWLTEDLPVPTHANMQGGLALGTNAQMADVARQAYVDSIRRYLSDHVEPSEITRRRQ